MSIVVQLNLPAPSDTLVTYVSDIVSNTKLNVDGKYWIDRQQNIDNSAEHLFFVEPRLDLLVREEFGEFFNRPIGGLIGIMRNNGDTPYAVQTPHVDRGRALGINYYIELGGNNVTSSFYDHVETTNPAKAKNFTYQDVADKKLGSIIFAKNQWYAFDVCRCHSIENIQTKRYFFSLYLKDCIPHSYTLADLTRDYPLLIGNTLKLV